MSEFNKTPDSCCFPAVDVAGGKAVRLTQGEAGTETSYGDPVDAAADWADQGAEWIHLVDLDAALRPRQQRRRPRRGHQAGPGRQVELSGGIRDDASLERARDRRQAHQPRHRRAGEPRVGRRRHRAVRRRHRRGPRRARHDARGPRLDQGRRRPLEVMDRLEEAGCARYVVTDVTKDGTLQGPNLDLLRQITARTPKPVVASGGVSSLDDIAALREARAAGPRGRHRRQGPLRRRVHAAEALDVAGH